MPGLIFSPALSFALVPLAAFLRHAGGAVAKGLDAAKMKRCL